MSIKLSDDLKYWRAERPSEWKMDEFIRKAEKMEEQVDKLQRALDTQSRILETTYNEMMDLKVINFKRFNEDECWIYQGDGEDYLESLVCPVVICPKKLIELIEG